MKSETVIEDPLSKIDDPIQLEIFEKLLQIREKRLSFATDHHRNTNGRPMDFKNHPHLPLLYNTLATNLVLQGSVQSMKSEFIIIDHLACSSLGLSVFMVLPKFEARDSYVQNRVDKCVKMVPEYRRQMAMGSFDNVVMKNFGKGSIKYVGSNVIGDFKEFPADVMFVEEVDQCDQANISTAPDRLRGSPFQFKRYVGNPTIDDFGVNAFYKNSTQNEWHVRCDCGQMNSMDWYETIIDTILDADGVPKEFNLKDENWKEGMEVRPVCKRCGDPFNRFNSGSWISKNPDSKMEGFLLTMLMSRFNSLTEMWYRFREAVGDQPQMQIFHNSDLGVPFSSFDSRLTTLHLKKASELDNYLLHIFPSYSCIEGDSCDGPCSMGIDVGKYFDVKILPSDMIYA